MKHQELIERTTDHMKGDAKLDYGELQEIVDALESFDLLQHLRDGGKVFSPSLNKAYPGSYYFWDTEAEGGVLFCNGNKDYVQSWAKIFVEVTDWQPYKEPPVEGSREWMIDQLKSENKMTHGSWMASFYIRMSRGVIIASNGENFNDVIEDKSIFPDSWSIWEEPPTCMICGNEIQDKEDGPTTANGVPLAHYECHGKYESYHALVSLREGTES